MAFQRLEKPKPYAGPAPAAAPSVPRRQTVAPTPAGVGGFQRLTKPQVVTNPVAAARAAQRQQAQSGTGGGGRRVATGIPGVTAPTTGGIQGVQYAGHGGFFGHLGSDVLNVITGLPAGAKTFVVDPVVASATGVYGAVGKPLGLPGAGGALKISGDIQRQGGKVLKATVKDYEQRYGPVARAIAHGHPLGALEAGGHAIYEHPGLVALDVATVVSGAGALARGGGAVAARVAPESAIGRVGARAADTRITPGSARYRQPARLESPVAEGTTYGARATATVHHRPYSRNPLTRAAIQKPAVRLVERARPVLAEAAPRIFGEQPRFERATARAAREIRLTGEEHLNTTVGELVAPYAKAAQKLRPIQTRTEALKALPRGVAEIVPHERDVVHLHLRGLLDQPGFTPVQARDRMVETMRANIAAAKAHGERTVAAERNVTRFAAIPEHYLNLDTAPAHVQTAVNEGRALIDETQRRAVASGLVTPETARASAERAVNVVLGGAKWDPRVLNWTPRAQEAASRALAADRRLQDLRRGRVMPGSVARPAEAERAAAAGTAAAGERGAREIALQRAGQRPLRMPTRWESAAEQTSRGFRRLLGQQEVTSGQARRAAQMLAHVEHTARTATQQGHVDALRQIARIIEEHTGHRILEPADALRTTPRVGLRTLGRHYVRTERAQQTARAAAEAPLRRVIRETVSERRGARTQLHAELSQGGFTPPRPGFQAGPQARYLPDIGADPVGRTAIARATGRLTKPPTYQSRGTLIGRGGVVTSLHLPIHATRTVLAHEQLGENVGNLIQATAYRHGGQIASGPKAVQLLRSDPDKVVLVSRRAVQHALSQMDELQPGETLNEGVASQLFHEVAPDEVTVRANPNDFIAIPKAAMNEWRQAAKAPTSLGRGYDSVLSLWKSGLLAFTPRWYTNNLITNAALYGLAAGGDLRALRQAAQETFKRPGVVPERIASTAATEYGRAAPSLGRAEALPRFKNAAAKGFALNNRLEAFWRRAAYIHTAQRVLRDEGGKFRHLSQEELADRIASMPDELKREALRITEDAMGNFRNFSRLERDVLKRVFPFYSWMRFVGSLTIGLPFHSPLRAEALALMSEAGKVENPLDAIRPLYQRGRINLPGGLAVPTTGMNPFSTVQDFVAAATSGAGPGDVATELVRAAAQQGASPVVQIAAGTWSGRNPFTGFDYSAPPGYGGSVASFGQEPQRFNQATGQWETYRPTPNILEQVAEAVPYVPQLRSMLSGLQRPYDVASTWDLIRHRLGGGPPAEQLFKPPPTRKRGTEPLPYISPLASLLGFNIQQVDPAADVAVYRAQQARAAAARAATQRARAKARARVGG